MRYLRLALRLIALAMVTGAAHLLVLVLRGRARLFFVQRDGRPAVCRAWAWVVARIVGLRVVADGPVPSAPGLLVANHLSYLDIIVLGSRVPAVFVARGDLAGWPVVGPVARAAGTLFIERSDRWRLPSVLAEVRRVIDTGGRVIVFPEGTSSDGRQVLPFRSSTLEPVAAVGLPVAWAALRYETGPGLPPPEQAVCWWGEMTLAGHLCRLLMLPRITAHVQFGRDPGGEPDRRELACRLQRAVSDAHASLLIRVGDGARHGSGAAL